MAKKLDTKKPIHEVNWYDDKYQSIVVFRNWMLLITLLCVIAVLAMTLAAYYFVPMKSVSPFVVQIDEKSGVTSVVTSKDAAEYTTNEMLIKYFSNQYITARENYNWRNLATNEDIVRFMSAGDVYRKYINDISGPNGMPALFQTRIERRVSLISSQVKTNKTSGEISIGARYYVTEAGEQRKADEYTIYVNLECSFNSEYKLSDEERLINPLGFRVVYYAATKENSDENNK